VGGVRLAVVYLGESIRNPKRGTPVFGRIGGEGAQDWLQASMKTKKKRKKKEQSEK